ncbi:MAG: SelL-related redox protein [Bacteroidota bacterium]
MAAVNIELDILSEMVTNEGQTIQEISDRQPVLLVFLRHFGCTFCREALADISKERAMIEEMGSKLVFVHMTDNGTAERYFNRYDLENATHISDPNKIFYRQFGLLKGNFNQLFGLQSWIRGFSAGVVDGHGVGPQLGDGFQMPGVFVIHQGYIKESFIHKLASDRPDYIELAKCCQIS